MSYGDEEDCALAAGTIYSRNEDDLLSGLPSQESFERSQSNRWLVCDKTDYASRGLYAGRAAGMHSATCHRRRFVATAIIPVAADEGDPVREDHLITAQLYNGELNDS
jgi:hypothetical protein